MKVEENDLKELMDLLETIEIPINYQRGRQKSKNHGSKLPAGKGRSVLLGKIPKKQDMSNFTKLHPDVYQACMRLASKYCPFKVESCMLNKNYQTQPHYDTHNTGGSVIFSFGNYQGGELVVEGNKVDTYMTTFMMDGKRQLHWNLPIRAGTKYSLVFFNTSMFQ